MSSVTQLPTLGITLPDGPLEYRSAAVSCEIALRKLAAICRARASDLSRPLIRHSGSESREPTGALRGGASEDPYGYYRDEMLAALSNGNPDGANVSRALRAASDATKAWLAETGRRQQHDIEAELLTDFEGYAAEDAARTLDQTVRWVRSRRLARGCDPDTGASRIKDERTEMIVRLHKAGVAQRVIAEEVGVTQGRVSQILAGR